MKSLGRLAAAFLCGSLLVAVGATTASAQTENCTEIISLPVTIAVPGTYCLQRDLGMAITTLNAITINVENVVVDLNGFTLEGIRQTTTQNVATTAKGIHAPFLNNITIRNGTVRGFLVGIDISGFGTTVESIRAERNTSVGIRIEAQNGIIRNNTVFFTGGSAAVGVSAAGTGISFLGSGGRLLNNDVSDTFTIGTGTDFASAIRVNGNSAVVENNRVINPTTAPRTRGITIAGSDVLVVNNRITNMASGIEFESGGGKFRDNLTSGVEVPYTGGTDAGNNN